MPETVTITLKIPVAEKRRMQAQARLAKKSLNAYVLDRVFGDRRRQHAKVDYDRLTAHLAGRFEGKETWRLVPGRE